MSRFVNSVKSRIIPKIRAFISTSFSDKYLFYTNVGLSLSLSGLGDIAEQRYEILTHKIEEWDRTRTRNMTVCGISIGVFCHHWYIFLDRKLPEYTFRTIMKKIVIDQFVCSPVCIVLLFVTCGILEQKNKEAVWIEMKQKGWKLFVAEWVLWPPAQFINFYFLPTKFRVLYDSSISLGYDVYTSYVKNSKTDTENDS